MSERVVALAITLTVVGGLVAGVTAVPASGSTVTDAGTQSLDGPDHLNALAFQDQQSPPTPRFGSDPLQLGEVEVGESESGSATVVEAGGDQGLDGVDVTVVSQDPNANLGFSGTNSVDTGPGGRDSVSWTVDVDDGVSQGQHLSWTVELTAAGGATQTVDVEAEAVTGELGDVTVDDTFGFDEPRSEVSEITQTIDVTVENVGGGTLEIDSASASAFRSPIEVVEVDEPRSIAPHSSGTVGVTVRADTDLDEGMYDFTAEVTAADGDVSSDSGGLEVVHETHLGVSQNRISIGDVPIGESDQRSVDVEEQLGYNGVDSVVVRQSRGPDQWLEISEVPSSLDAGGVDSAVVEVAFDTDAEIGETYEWSYRIDASDAQSAGLTITATAIPLDLEPIKADLSGYERTAGDHGTVAAGTLDLVEQIDADIRSGDVDDSDVTTMLTFGNAAISYVESAEEAERAIDNGDHDDAQSHIVQAAVGYNTMTLLVDGFERDEFRTEAAAVLDHGEDGLDQLIGEQESYYDDALSSNEVSLIDRATINRDRSQIALLQGDDERATELQRDADDAFEQYRERVTDGERARQEAQSSWDEFEDETATTVAGHPVLLNPASYDAFTETVDEVESNYEQARTAFETSGEPNRADEISSERESWSTDVTTARLTLFASIVVYLLLVVGIVAWTAKGMYWYVQDSRESTAGDFLA